MRAVHSNHERTNAATVSLRFFSDNGRHLVCYPFSVENLHAMAAELQLKRAWFHAGRHPHYDIPKRRIKEIASRTEVVSGRTILAIAKGGPPPVTSSQAEPE